MSVATDVAATSTTTIVAAAAALHFPARQSQLQPERCQAHHHTHASNIAARRLKTVIIIPNLWQQKPDETGKIRCRRKTNETMHKTTSRSVLAECAYYLQTHPPSTSA